MMIDNFTIHALAEAELTLNRIKAVYNIEEQVECEKNRMLKEKMDKGKSVLSQDFKDALEYALIRRRNL